MTRMINLSVLACSSCLLSAQTQQTPIFKVDVVSKSAKASNDSAQGRQQNRRVDIVVSGEVIGTTIGKSGNAN